MKATIVFACLLASLSCVVFCDIKCEDPSPYEGQYVGESHEWVALVKKLCDGMLNFATYNWKRGRNVKDNCKSIEQSGYTAVATFVAPGNKYKGHAAIFESCDSEGVWVWDQWVGQKVHRRRIYFGDERHSPRNDGSELYTIEK